MQAMEPTPEALRNPLARYFLATRPAFLIVTLVGALVGFAVAFASGVALSPAVATLAILLALIAHAAVNVLNDYYDAVNGTDAINTERVFPFTGGSRFIQNGVLTMQETARYGWALVGVVIVGGLVLTAWAGPGLVAIGLVGLLIGWAYSAPPLALNSRGLGELCVTAGFALVVIGSDFVLRRAFAPEPIVAAISYGLLVANILYINQFPDRKADEAAGKHHWVVRLGAERAVYGYYAIAIAAHGWIVLAVLAGRLPAVTLVALGSAPLAFQAARILRRFAAQPSELAPALKLTIGTAVIHGVLLALALIASRFV